jgi:hypothetical protein
LAAQIAFLMNLSPQASSSPLAPTAVPGGHAARGSLDQRQLAAESFSAQQALGVLHEAAISRQCPARARRAGGIF